MTTTERLRPLPPPTLDAEDRLHRLTRERLVAGEPITDADAAAEAARLRERR